MTSSSERIPILLVSVFLDAGGTSFIFKFRAQDGMEPAVVFIGPGLREASLSASFHRKSPIPDFKLGH